MDQTSDHQKGNVIENREVYDDLVRSHARDVYRFAFRLCGSVDKAEDLVQDTMYHAWRSIDSLRNPSSARSWLFQIMHNRFKHALRTQGRRIRTTEDDGQLSQAIDRSTTDVGSRILNQDLLQKALDDVDERFKAPFLLVFMQEMTCREAAEVLDLPLGTVLSRIHRARQLMREAVLRLDPTCDEPHGNGTAGKTGHDGLKHKLSNEND